MRPINEDFTACAKAALEHDYAAVPWDEAPDWRQHAAYAVAEAALDTGNPDFTRSAWFLAMTTMGWRWAPAFDEAQKAHPGIVSGELTAGGSKHWMNVVNKVRAVARLYNVRMTGP